MPWQLIQDGTYGEPGFVIPGAPAALKRGGERSAPYSFGREEAGSASYFLWDYLPLRGCLDAGQLL